MTTFYRNLQNHCCLVGVFQAKFNQKAKSYVSRQNLRVSNTDNKIFSPINSTMINSHSIFILSFHNCPRAQK